METRKHVKRRNFILGGLASLAAMVPGISLLAGRKPKSPPLPPKEPLRTTYIWRCIGAHGDAHGGVEDWAWVPGRLQDLKSREKFVLIDPSGEFVCGAPDIFAERKVPAIWLAVGKPYQKDGVWTVNTFFHAELDPEQFADNRPRTLHRLRPSLPRERTPCHRHER